MTANTAVLTVKPNWLTVIDAGVSCFPLKDSHGNVKIDPETGKANWMTVGPWVKTGDGRRWQWYEPAKTDRPGWGSITCHWPRVQKLDKLGRPMFEVKRACFAPVPVLLPEHKERYDDWDTLIDKWKDHPLGLELIEALADGKELAIVNHAAKMAAARAA